LRLTHQRHVIDRAVTGRATDALGDVDRVIEIDVVGQLVDLAPVDRPVFGETRAHRREHRGLRVKLRMTGHAGVRRRHAGDRRYFDSDVAIAAIKAEAPDVVLMAEGHRLI
jgi:hypothetical protein